MCLQSGNLQSGNNCTICNLRSINYSSCQSIPSSAICSLYNLPICNLRTANVQNLPLYNYLLTYNMLNLQSENRQSTAICSLSIYNMPICNNLQCADLHRTQHSVSTEAPQGVWRGKRQVNFGNAVLSSKVPAYIRDNLQVCVRERWSRVAE